MTGLPFARGASFFTRSESLEPEAFVERDLVVDPCGEAARRWGEVIDELLRMRRLRDDWDGEGSPSPGSDLVDSAITFAQNLAPRASPPHRVHAGVNGTIFFEWYSPSGYREIELFAPGRAESRSVAGGAESVAIKGFKRRA